MSAETKVIVPEQQLLIITGMSGAGKSQVMGALEDIGYFCIDNLPPSLLIQFVNNIRASHRGLSKMAVVVDIRGGETLANLTAALQKLTEQKQDYRVLFMDAADATLISRFKATRRRHPLSADGLGLIGAIVSERGRLEEILGLADIVIDTTEYSPARLSEHICDLFAGKEKLLPALSICSFGFKYGLPMDADLVVDVRFLPNPYYNPEMRPLTGHQPKVRDFVMKQDATREFIRRYLQLLRFLLPQYKKEGKRHLLLAVGCTGGRHRSVAIAEHLAKRLRMLGYHVVVAHRDIERGDLK